MKQKKSKQLKIQRKWLDSVHESEQYCYTK